MRLPAFIVDRLRRRLRHVAAQRRPDFVIGGESRPYIRRWWLIPRNRWFNVYLHQILRDDDDRALHDHPWPNLSILLSGGYVETTPDVGVPPLTAARTGFYQRRAYLAGQLRFRRATAAHRLELLPVAVAASPETWSLFITGPVLRAWGFWCPQGWRHWREFTNPADAGATVGNGCGE